MDSLSKFQLNGKVKAYNLDAREFIKQAIIDLKNPSIVADLNDTSKKNFVKHQSKKRKIDFKQLDRRNFDHFVMNLPATAPSFLDTFKGIFSREDKLPMIHVYCFSKSDTPEKDAVEVLDFINYRILKAF